MSEPSFDWCSFYALFWNDKGFKCKINVPDTVLFRYGQLSAWWSTNKDGCVQRHTSQHTTVEAIRRRLIAIAQEDEANYSKYVCISRHGDGRPQLLRPQAFNQLCELLSDRLECGHPDVTPEVETPSVLQAFIQPYQDLRYITTYINSGTSTSCHTFQRKYSRRYAAMSASTAAGTDPAAMEHLEMMGLGAGSQVIGSVADAERRAAEADQQMGAVEPILKMQLRKTTAHLVKYIQMAHNLTLGGIVCEYIKDASGKVYLLSVLRTEWASNAAGNGGGSYGAAALQQTPKEAPAGSYLTDEGYDEVVGGNDDMLGSSGQVPYDSGERFQYVPEDDREANGWEGGPVERSSSPTTLMEATWRSQRQVGPSEGSRRPASASSPLVPTQTLTGGAGGAHSSLSQFPGGNRATAIPMSVTNTWPSLQHDAHLPSHTGAPNTLPATLTSAAPVTEHRGTAAMRAQSAKSSAYGASVRDSASRARSIAGNAAAPGSARGMREGGSRPASSPPRGHSVTARPIWTPGRTPRSPAAAAAAAATAAASALSASGIHVNGGLRGAPMLIQHLQKEVETLRDQLTFQNELAEASAAKIRQLEYERDINTGAYTSHSNDQASQLSNTREELAQAQADIERWRSRAELAEAKCAELENRTYQLDKTVNDERATTMKILKDYQTKDAQLEEKSTQLEAEVVRLNDQLKGESTAVLALKRQLMQFSDIAERYQSTIKDGNIDEGMEEVLEKIGPLFSGQANPTGEQYAVQKILSHYTSDLRAVFLHYAQLDSTFTEHWPPSLTFSQWMLYCKDSRTSDNRASSRMRSTMNPPILSPADCEAIFIRYARAATPSEKGVGKESSPSHHNNSSIPPAARGQILPYTLFLAAIVHVASKLKRTDLSFLSEGVREYIIRHVSRAEKAGPTPSRKGGIRTSVLGASHKAGEVALEHHTKVTSPALTDPINRGGGSATASNRQRPQSARKAAGGGKQAAGQVASGSGGEGGAVSPPQAGAGLVFSSPDTAASAIERELSMLGLQTSSTAEPVRRGGGFDVL
ncbi:hypothetical protein CEUSTIGMA_g6220.t1 [Chlamydomonas eustigma]|uniref:Uncharacterized protein n=1 Tax=Chlamydomonas eustigma TaxID=1157962 RepID=A0A250X6R6_9CHLO|nr:hypothetical protein CEUSTIGMA_g6220.t1 [Chlamydomonas eustigma]|eukprot:GAX78783.1 hypothetical protein CEUSTIGMA_g6220.t1 [Chlamydomonas eustigma]